MEQLQPVLGRLSMASGFPPQRSAGLGSQYGGCPARLRRKPVLPGCPPSCLDFQQFSGEARPLLIQGLLPSGLSWGREQSVQVCLCAPFRPPLCDLIPWRLAGSNAELDPWPLQTQLFHHEQ